MRHLNSGSKLGKQPAHRRAVLRSLVTNLFEHGRITTTLTRAKAARPVAEKMITLGKRDTLQSRRQAASYIMLPAVTQKLFSEIAPKFADRVEQRIVSRCGAAGDERLVNFIQDGISCGAKKCREAPRPAPPFAVAAHSAIQQQAKDKIFHEVRALSNEIVDRQKLIFSKRRN